MKGITPFPVLVLLLILMGSACGRSPGDDSGVDSGLDSGREGSIQPVYVAVASNFMVTMEILSAEWERETGLHATLTSGSTGKLFAQIEAGAPYDVFLAADTLRPARLDHRALGRAAYATGRLALWSPSWSAAPGRTAIANPETAPYGAAALDALSSATTWQDSAWWTPPPEGLVFGESVSQAYTFVATGHAHRGFVALSSLIQSGRVRDDALPADERGTGSSGIWIVPDSLHTPIEQHMVLLSDQDAARSFFEWMQSPAARRIIRAHGYNTP